MIVDQVIILDSYLVPGVVIEFTEGDIHKIWIEPVV